MDEISVDMHCIKEFENLPEAETYKVIASSIEPNKFHKGEFIIKQIVRDMKGKKYKRMIFIEKSLVKRFKEKINTK